MKNISLIITVLLFSFAITGCDPYADDFTPSRITVYPDIMLEGDQTMFVNVGDDFEDPGAETDTGDPITSSGTVDTSTPGIYNIRYTAVNEDGFEATETRTVYVSNTGDFDPSLEGIYYATGGRADTDENYEDQEFARIWEVGENQYQISHALGGFYSMGRAYGEAYSATGAVITDNGDGTYEISDATVVGFGLTVSFSNVQVDPETRTISYDALFAGLPFKVSFEQLQF